MTDILMPALSPTMEEGALAKWHIKVGDTIASGDVIAEIETDKATMEVEAVDEGVVEAILVAEGAEGVKVNTPIARLKGGEGAAGPPQASPAQPPENEPLARVVEERAAAAPPEQVTAAPETKAETGRQFVSPLARRVAQQRGVDLVEVKGSGPHGRIILADLEAKTASEAAPGSSSRSSAPAAGSAPQPASPVPPNSGAAPPAPAPAQAASLEQLGIAPGSYDLVPLDGMRRTIARRLSESFRNVPHFPLDLDLEIDRLLEARGRINTRLEGQGVRVSVNDLLIKACASALKAVPEANASFSPEGIALHHHADIAVAVAIEGGLITPIIRQAETRTLADISRAMKDLAERAKSRKLKPEEYHGGTFSLSNLGMFGIRSFSSIINEPQGCILSVGVGEKRAVVKANQLAIATVMSVTLTCDHRAVDGAVGARWMQAFKSYVEDPVTMLA